MRSKPYFIASSKGTNIVLHCRRTWAICILVGLAIAAVAAAVMTSTWLETVPRGLQYNGFHYFSLSSGKWTVETRTSGEEGEATLLITSPTGIQSRIASRFNRDLYMDVRPAYVSWKNVDGQSGNELLIWTPTAGSGMELKASHFLSGSHPGVQTIKPPLQTGFFF